MKLTELHQIRENEEKSILSVMGEQNKEHTGDFECRKKSLTSLLGSPSAVTGDYDCSFNNLTSLEGSPGMVDEDFLCYSNKLTSLEGGPSFVYKTYDCSNNALISLEGAPERIDVDFDCSENSLTTLVGAPSHIAQDLIATSNNFSSLQGIHKHIKFIGYGAYFKNNPIESHVLGLVLIRGLRKVSLENTAVAGIINKHLEGDRDVFACQEELIEAGFEEFAQL